MTAKSGFIQIIAPKEGKSVPWRPFVEGTTKDLAAKIWVVIHPMNATEYWVQPKVSVKETGSWKVQAYIGRPGNLDIDRRYEVIAVGNPKSNLREGGVLDSWPDAEYCSQIVEVIRKTGDFQLKSDGQNGQPEDPFKNRHENDSKAIGESASSITEDALKQLTFRELLQRLSIGAWVWIIGIIIAFISAAFFLGIFIGKYQSQIEKGKQSFNSLDTAQIALITREKDRTISEKDVEIKELKKEAQMLRDRHPEIPLTVFDKTTGNKLHIEKPISHPGYYEFPIILHDGKNSIRIDQYYFAKRMGIKFDGE